MKRITILIVLLTVFFGWSSMAQITTFPYVEDFEAGDGGWVANGGSWALGAPAAPIINSAASGTNAWVTNLTGAYGNSEQGNVQSPVFDFSALNAPSIEFSIWWNSEFSWDGMVLQSSIDGGGSWQVVGVLGDPNNWYNDGTINGNPGGQQLGWTGRGTTGSGGWVIARHALNGLAGESNVLLRFAFGSDGSVTDEGVAFDAINIFDVLCPEPFNLTATPTENSVDITWTPGGSETAWEVVVQPAGTGVPTGAGTPTTNNNPYTESSLTPSTQYEIYVRSDCGPDGFSSWAGPLNFATLNVPPPPPVGVTCASGTPSYIFTESFETDPVSGWTGTTFSGNDGDWDITPGNANSFGSGPSASFDGGMHLEYEAGGSATNVANAISPAIDLTPAVDGAELSFYMHAFGADIGTLNVGIGTDPAGPFTTVFSWIGEYQTTDTEAWVPVGINIDSYLGQVIYLQFSYGGAGTGFEGDMSIDFIRVQTCGSFCIAPSGLVASNIGGTTADISWTANNAETSWEYVVVPAGTGPPTGSGTVSTTTTVNLTMLDFSTTYDVYVRADCGGGFFSVWAGPLTFTTTEQTDFVVDCSAGPVNIMTCYDDGQTPPTVFTFTSSDGTPLNITFNSGNVENNFDELIVLDSDGTTDLNAATPYGNAGNVAGLFYQSTGDTVSFFVQYDGIVDCATSTTINPLDVTVSCATCINPAATYTVVSDCLNAPQFFIEVDITSVGDASSITVSDDQGSADQTVTTTGIVTFGPYPVATDVVITVANDDDVNCIINSNPLTLEFCLDTLVDCDAGPITINYCYENNDSNVFSYTSSDGNPLNLVINSGEIEGAPWDFLVILDSDGVTELYNGEGNDGDLSGLSFQSTGDTIFFSITADGVISCASGSFPDGVTYTVSCATCINPAATYAVIDDCENGDQFLIDVIISSIGDANSVTVTDNQGSAGITVTEAGTVQFGPYPFNTPIVITISNDQDVNCVINSQPISVPACPPDNDNCVDATVAFANPGESCDMITPGTILAATPSGVPNGSCTGNPDDDVWFSFQPLGEQSIIQINNITGGTTNLDHALYEGVCGALVEVYCSADTFSVTPALTVGATYYIRVFSAGSLEESSNFNLCIQTLGVPTFCLDALPICDDFTYPSVVGDDIAPPYLDYGCLGSEPDPTWNSIYFDLPGDYTFNLSQIGEDGLGNDIDFIVWGPFNTQEDVCNNLLPENIVDCSYSATAFETVEIFNVQAGDVYIILITNFSQQPGTYTFEQVGGPDNGINCEIVCDVEVLYQDTPVQEDMDNPGFSDPIYLCGFDNIDLVGDSPYADTYVWYQDGFEIATTQILNVTESNTYQVQASGEVCDGSSFSLIVPVIFLDEAVANAVPDLVTCDDASGDGIAEFDLDAQTAGILGSQDPSGFVVTYHASLADAQAGINPLTSPYTNTSNPQTICARVEDVDAVGLNQGCFATTCFDLVISGPTPTVTTVDYEACDDDSNDGFADFDLPTQDLLVLGTQNPADFNVSYYATQADAEAGINPLTSPYTNTSNPQVVWVRIESNASASCFGVGSINLIVIPTPVANAVPDVGGCDADGDTVPDFDLTVNESDIIGGQTGMTVSYHTSQADADTGDNAIGTPNDYSSTIPAIIYVRVEDGTTGCYATTSFNLVAGDEPTINSVPDVEGCDADDDGQSDFDLTLNEDDIIGGQSGLMVTYYTSQADADAATNEIANPTDYSVDPSTIPFTIYVRVEDVATGCFATITFDLIDGEEPVTTFTTDFDYEVCPNATVPIIITATAQNYSPSEVTIVWYLNDNVIVGENGLSIPVLVEGLYEIEVTFIDSGCRSITEQQVIELETCIFPEGISPGVSPGQNDTFDLTGFNVTRIEIFNRYGTRVFEANDYTDQWHGQGKNGEELPVGTYYYTVTYQGGQKKTGWVYINK